MDVEQKTDRCKAGKAPCVKDSTQSLIIIHKLFMTISYFTFRIETGKGIHYSYCKGDEPMNEKSALLLSLMNFIMGLLRSLLEMQNSEA